MKLSKFGRTWMEFVKDKRQMCSKEIEGTWLEGDLRRAFVMGAKWWEFHSTGATMWQSDRNIAEVEADKRYPNGKIPEESEYHP